MIKKLLESNLIKLSEEDSIELFENWVIATYGGKEQAINALKKLLNKKGELDLALFSNEFNLKFFEEFKNVLLSSENINELIISLHYFVTNDSKNLVTNESIFLASLEALKNLEEPLIEKLKKSGFSIEQLVDKKFISQQSIADEFELNKKTFVNILEMLSLNFSGRKGLTFSEYAKIHNAFVDFPKDDPAFKKSAERLKKGKTLRKIDIVEITESDYKTILPNLTPELQNLYQQGNIFPYNIARKFIEKMGSEMDF